MRARQGSRRDELLEAIVDYLLEHGLADLSLRPLAAAIGSKARLLIYHFGSRDALVTAALAGLLHRIQAIFLTTQSDAPLDRALLGFWRFATDKKNERYLRLTFEVHGLAIHYPELFGEYVHRSLESWRQLIADRLPGQDATRRQREEQATSIIALFDGLLLDYLATGELERPTRALVSFTKRLKQENGGRR